MTTTFKFRRGTSIRWTTLNPILKEGEPGFEVDTKKIKIGDGLTRWVDLTYLSGAGAPGPKGDPGEPGQDGVNGADGIDGASAYELAVEAGYVGSISQWLESLKGEEGDPGIPGVDGTNGTNGASAYDLAVANGFVGNISEWLASLQGEPGAPGTDGEDGDDYSGPAITVSPTAPSSPSLNDVWIDTSA